MLRKWKQSLVQQRLLSFMIDKRRTRKPFCVTSLKRVIKTLCMACICFIQTVKMVVASDCFILASKL